MSPKNIIDLPLEILSQILSLLPYYPDFQNARLACNKLYSASLDIKFLNKEEVIFGNENYPVELQKLLQSQRTFWHFRFLNATSFSPNPKIWSYLGPNLKSLLLFQCDITEDQLFVVLSHCTWLKQLVISSCSIEINTGSKSLNNLENLNLVDNFAPHLSLESFGVDNQLDRRLFWRILRHTPNLKVLSVDGLKGVHSHILFHLPELDESNDSTFLRVNNIFEYLKVCGHRLNGLRLILDNSKPWLLSIAREDLSSALSQLDNMQLRTFSTNVEVQKEFFLKQKNCLEELVLEHVTHDDLAVICRELQNLKHLDVTTVLFTASDVKCFTLLKNLISLRISLLYAPVIIDSDVFTGLCGKENTTLKVLELRHTVDKVLVSPGCISSLTQTFHSLVDLNLYGCDGVSDSSMQSIFCHLPSLESLELCQCRNLTDAAVQGGVQETHHNSNRTDIQIYSITRLKKLRLLDLSCCMKFTGEAFNSELKLPELRDLNLSYNEISRESLVRLTENNPTIEYLGLDGCIQLTDDLVQVLVNNLSRLRYINIGIISHILSFLPHAALRDVRLVCHRLYNASSDPNILDREILIFDGNSDRSFNSTLLQSIRTFRNFRLENDQTFSYRSDVWSRFGPNLKSLSFLGCNLKEKWLFAILSHCTRLKHLKIGSCCVKISTETASKKPYNNEQLAYDNSLPLDFLESFSVSRLDSRTFWKILRCSRNLTSLSVERLTSFIDPFFQKNDTDPSGSVWAEITIADIVGYLKINGHRLKDLQLMLDETNISYGTHNELPLLLSQLDNLCLKRFSSNIDLREDPNNKYIMEFLSKQTDCRDLTLGPLASDMFDFICRELSNLEHLDLQNVVFLTDCDVKNLTSLKNLVSLRISLLRPHRTRWIQYDMYADLCGDVNKTLKVLELPCTRKQILVTQQCISTLTRTYPALTHLNLYGCNALNNISVQNIFRHLLSLESLILRYCWGLSDPGLKGSASSEEDTTEKQTGYGITRLKRLRLLDLSCCPLITGEAFTDKFKLPELQQLFLNHNKIFSERLICVFENNPSIERLEVIGNNYMKITDDCVYCMVKNLRYLRYITIGENSEISPECMKLLQEHCRSVVTKKGPFYKNEE